jgi:hypothetical protein
MLKTTRHTMVADEKILMPPPSLFEQTS